MIFNSKKLFNIKLDKNGFNVRMAPSLFFMIGVIFQYVTYTNYNFFGIIMIPFHVNFWPLFFIFHHFFLTIIIFVGIVTILMFLNRK